MQELPKTFCPAKWDELFLNVSYNYAYACCKATPVTFYNDYNKALNQQKQNLLNGVQDSSCEYCWATERNNGKSLRLDYLEKFDVNQFESYKNNTVPVTMLEVNLGNSCNLQCTYCGPKFSSLWEEDIKKKKYPIFTDRFNYEIVKKSKDVQSNNLSLIADIKHTRLSIIGGEPLTNNKLFEILDAATSEIINITTNLMVDTDVLDKLISYHTKFNRIVIGCSIDAVGEMASFLRHGIDLDLFHRNLKYLIDHSADNVYILVQSLMTNISVLDIQNTIAMVSPLVGKKVKWHLTYCVNPKIFSFESLPDLIKPRFAEYFDQITTNPDIRGAASIASALRNIKFDTGIFNEFIHFIDEWEIRKNVKVPSIIR